MPHPGFDIADFAPVNVVLNSAGGPTVGVDFSATLDHEEAGGVLRLTYTITNISGVVKFWPLVALPTGWDDVGGTAPLTRRWLASYKWKTDHVWSAQPWTTHVAIGYGVQIQAACCAVDDGVGTTIGWGTDWPYFFWLKMLTWLPGRITFSVHPDTGGQAAINYATKRVTREQLFHPAETKTITFWLKVVEGAADEAASVESVSPYVDHLRENWPYDPGEMPRGRLMALHLAQHEASATHPAWDGTRQYWRFGRPGGGAWNNTGTLVDAFSGWYALLDAIVADYGGLAAIKAAGYVGLMAWAASGFHSYGNVPVQGNNYMPSVVRNLPTNLATTLAEIAQWEADRDFKVGLWCGYGLAAVQYGAWDGTSSFPQEDGEYYSIFDAGGLGVPTANAYRYVGEWDDAPTVIPLSAVQASILDPAARAEFEANVFAALEHFSFVGLDAVRSRLFDPWVEGLMREMRAEHPTKGFVHETQSVDRFYGIAPPIFNADQFEGRCALMEAIYPGWRGMGHVWGFGNHSLMPPMAAELEAADMDPVIVALPPPEFIDDATGYPARDGVVLDGATELPWGGANLDLGTRIDGETDSKLFTIELEVGVAVTSVEFLGSASGAVDAEDLTVELDCGTPGTAYANVLVHHDGDGSPQVLNLIWESAMSGTISYSRPKSATINATPIVFRTYAVEDPVALTTGNGTMTAGSTGITKIQLLADADESVANDVQPIAEYKITPSVAEDGTTRYAVEVKWIDGDGTETTVTQTFTHHENMDAWQTAAGRPRQS